MANAIIGLWTSIVGLLSFLLFLSKSSNLFGQSINAESQAASGADWFSKTLPLLGVIIGGSITYFTNSRLKRREARLAIEAKRCENVYIPMCTSIELIRKVSYGTDSGDLGEIVAYCLDEDEWKSYKVTVDDSLTASKRPFHTRESLELIKNLKTSIDYIYHQIDVCQEDALNGLEEAFYQKIEKRVGEMLSKKIPKECKCWLGYNDASDIREGILIGSFYQINIDSMTVYFSDEKNTQSKEIEFHDEKFQKYAMLSEDDIGTLSIADMDKIAILALKYTLEVCSEIKQDNYRQFDEVFYSCNKKVVDSISKSIEIANFIYEKFLKAIDKLTL